MSVNFTRIGTHKYRIERTSDMQADAVFFANDAILPKVTQDRSLEQLQQTASLPHLASPVLGMPDMHQGYGIPVGGVLASDQIVSAGAVGMDINCGVRLLRTGVDFDERVFDERGLRELVRRIEDVIPIGLGGEYDATHANIRLQQVILDGAAHLVSQGYGTDDDLRYCEEEGRIDSTNPDALSQKSLNRARKQIGTLGSGNHFLELQRVTAVYDDEMAETLGLHEGSICFMIHSGSRALGHQTCKDYSQQFMEVNQDTHPELVPNKALASAFVDSQIGQAYLQAMNGAINFAFANRHMIAYQFQQVFSEYMDERGKVANVELVYDVAHNSAKWEEHDGQSLLVHRKGATRALPPGHPQNPPAYADIGHPAFIPGSMGTPSYILVGTEQAADTYYSVNHGAGRVMSRREAKRTFSETDFNDQMGQVIYNQPYSAIADEAPRAYKDVDAVIETLVEVGITRRVVQLSPLAVIKGD